ncbi:MAG: hypothetical protein Q8P18_07145 [Pseudomonadota bacterium]|nr:hypothetical protein [Pseudomonadota bacterium]
MALQVRFHVLDDRAPTDLGHYYISFRNTLAWWQQHGVVNWRIVDTPYSLLLATLGAIRAPTVAFMEGVDTLWLLVLLLGAAGAARAASGPASGATAGAVTALALLAFPQTHVLARTHWIHHPEAAALVGALGLWLSAPALPRRGQALGVAALLFLGETIRQTGIPFGVPLGLLILAVAWRRGARRTLVPVALAFVGGLAWFLPTLLVYVRNKAGSAEGYAQSVTAPWSSIVDDLGLAALVWAVPLALVGAGALRRRDLSSLIAGLCLVWLAGAGAAVAVFNVGPDNFPIAAVALAVLAGMGAAALPVVARPGAVALGGVAAVLLQVPPLLSYELVSRLPAALRTSANPGPLNYLRVYWNPVPVEGVLSVVDQMCSVTRADPRANCFILATRGLFNPSWEDGGTFALFLSGRPRVTIVTPEVLWTDDGRATGETSRIHGLVDVRCAEGVAPRAGGRFLRQSERMRTMLAANFESNGGTSVATFGDPRACVQTWYLLPDDGGVLVE